MRFGPFGTEEDITKQVNYNNCNKPFAIKMEIVTNYECYRLEKGD